MHDYHGFAWAPYRYNWVATFYGYINQDVNQANIIKLYMDFFKQGRLRSVLGEKGDKPAIDQT